MTASVALDAREGRHVEDDTTPLRPLWLSHHYACDATRCVGIGRIHVCRRCLAVFAGFVPALALLSSPWRDNLQAGDFGLVLAFTIVAGIEFLQVVRRRTPYSSVRVLVLSPPVGAVMAWLAVTGVRDGVGVAHMAFGAAASSVLGLLFVHGTILRRRA